MIMKKIKLLFGYRKYKKQVLKKQKNYDVMLKACASDNNAVLVGERPELLSFLAVIKIVVWE